MRAYGEFADLYDLFMEDIPYASWKDFICGYLAKQGIRDGILLDLGCGTGQMTRLLRDAGYDMIGAEIRQCLPDPFPFSDRYRGKTLSFSF